jgi:hypothetical protein
VRTASGCLCGRRLLQEANDGTCLVCGHGDVHVVQRGLRRLPRDLGAIQRSGRPVPPGRYLNCVRV